MHVGGTVVVVVVDGCGGSHAIAWKATDASLGDTDVSVLFSVAVKCNLRKLAT